LIFSPLFLLDNFSTYYFGINKEMVKEGVAKRSRDIGVYRTIKKQFKDVV